MGWRLGDEGKVKGKLSCREPLRWALTHLAPQCEPGRLEALVNLVDVSMTLPGRYYHGLAHALMVAESNDPIDSLIGLFHDIVQAGVDGGLPPGCEAYIEGLIGRTNCGEFCLLESEAALADPIFNIVRRCFGFSNTETLSPFAGQNEFLSALIAGKALGDPIDTQHLAALALGIEATVPFRKHPDSSAPAYISALMDINHRHHAEISESDMRSHIRRAVRIANRDVQSFGEPDVGAFLDNTWKLMYESSTELRSGDKVGVTSYRQTLQRMTRFLSSLAAPDIFWQYDGEPNLSDHQNRLSCTARNLDVISEILHAKLLAMSLIESADGFGCHAFLPARLKLTPVAKVSASGMTAQDVLAAGSAGKAEFDLRQSPLSHKLWQQLSREDIRAHIDEIDLSTAVSDRLIQKFPPDIQSQARQLARAMLI